MIVIITGAQNESCWYKDKIGKLFDVFEQNKNRGTSSHISHFAVKDEDLDRGTAGITLKMIDKRDCKIYEGEQNVRILQRRGNRQKR